VRRQPYTHVLLWYKLGWLAVFQGIHVAAACKEEEMPVEGNGCCLQTVRGVIFASGLQREVFTAGNDIKELYAPKTSIARHARATTLFHVFASQSNPSARMWADRDAAYPGTPTFG
jgi:hypothetical protein